jgi:hypothetical protein
MILKPDDTQHVVPWSATWLRHIVWSSMKPWRAPAAASLQFPVVAMIGKPARHAPGDLLHVHVDAAAGLARQPVDLFGKVHPAEDRVDLFVLVGREQPGRIADRHPFDRNKRVRRQHTAHMDHAVDANLRAPPDDRALIDLDARRQEALVLDHAALERRLRPDQDMVADLDGVPARAADVEILADDALGADPHRRTMRLDHRPERHVRAWTDRHVAADHRRRGHIGGRIDVRPLILMLDKHGRIRRMLAQGINEGDRHEFRALREAASFGNESVVRLRGMESGIQMTPCCFRTACSSPDTHPKIFGASSSCCTR